MKNKTIDSDLLNAVLKKGDFIKAFSEASACTRQFMSLIDIVSQSKFFPEEMDCVLFKLDSGSASLDPDIAYEFYDQFHLSDFVQFGKGFNDFIILKFHVNYTLNVIYFYCSITSPESP